MRLLQLFVRQFSLANARWLIFTLIFALIEDRFTSFLNQQIDKWLSVNYKNMVLILKNILNYMPHVAWTLIAIAGFFVFIEAARKAKRMNSAFNKYPSGKWFGNEFLLSEPELEMHVTAIENEQSYECTLSCPPNTLARLRCDVGPNAGYFSTSDMKFVIRMAGSKKGINLDKGVGNIDVLVDDSSRIEYEFTGQSDIPVFLRVYLLGWRENL